MTISAIYLIIKHDIFYILYTNQHQKTAGQPKLSCRIFLIMRSIIIICRLPVEEQSLADVFQLIGCCVAFKHLLAVVQRIEIDKTIITLSCFVNINCQSFINIFCFYPFYADYRIFSGAVFLDVCAFGIISGSNIELLVSGVFEIERERCFGFERKRCAFKGYAVRKEKNGSTTP